MEKQPQDTGRKPASDPESLKSAKATLRKAEERYAGEGARTEMEAAEGLFELLSDDPEFGGEGSSDDGGSRRGDEETSRAADEIERLASEELEGEEIEPEGEEEPEPSPDSDVDLIEVQVAGETERVSLEELKAGYSRTSDYTRKTQELAEEKKETQQLRESYLQRAEAYDERLGLLEQALQEQGPQEPDWDRLEKEDPERAALEWAKWNRHQQQLQAIQQERQRNYQEAMAEQQRAIQERVAEEKRKLQEVVPGWDDPENREQELGELVEYARGIGFSDTELNQIYDHRAIVVMRKAMLYDKLSEKAKNVLKEKRQKAKTLKPGQSRGSAGKKRRTEKSEVARERFARSRTTRDAAGVIETMLESE